MPEKRIQAIELSKAYGERLAVDRLSLQVRAGEIYGLVGPDGAGKTTCMRLLCGALQPDHGQVLVADLDMSRQPEQAREQLGYLSQRFSLYQELTVLENLRFFAEVRGLGRDQWYARAMEILAFVGLADFSDRRAGYLSGGMKQKLGLATALVHRPRILLLDEPTGGVDPLTRQDFWQLIIRLVNQEGLSVLVSTPYMDEAVRCTYVGFMRHGRLVVEDHPRALIERLAGRILEVRSPNLAALRALAAADPDVMGMQTFGDRLHLRVRSGQAGRTRRRLQRTARAQGLKQVQIEPVPAQLEDVFIALLDDSPRRSEGHKENTKRK